MGAVGETVAINGDPTRRVRINAHRFNDGDEIQRINAHLVEHRTHLNLRLIRIHHPRHAELIGQHAKAIGPKRRCPAFRHFTAR